MLRIVAAAPWQLPGCTTLPEACYQQAPKLIMILLIRDAGMANCGLHGFRAATVTHTYSLCAQMAEGVEHSRPLQ